PGLDQPCRPVFVVLHRPRQRRALGDPCGHRVVDGVAPGQRLALLLEVLGDVDFPMPLRAGAVVLELRIAPGEWLRCHNPSKGGGLSGFTVRNERPAGGGSKLRRTEPDLVAGTTRSPVAAAAAI